MDERTCPICRALHNYTWTFVVGEDKIGNELIHPQFGVVWSVSQGSRAHGHQNYNCRCHIEPEVDLSDLKEKVQSLLQNIEETVPREQLR